MHITFKTIILSLTVLGFLGVSLTLYFNAVPKTISDTDVHYIHAILESSGLDIEDLKKKARSSDFGQEIAVIRAAQDAVLIAAPTDKKIPLGQEREPKDLYLSDFAQCSDRSRTLNKMIQYLGLKSRQLSMFKLEDGQGLWSTITALLSDKTTSHAIIEIKTAKGWMFIDTNNRWIALNADGEPISLKQWKRLVHTVPQDYWSKENKEKPYSLIEQHFVYIYGLYSRNGHFYPPYNFIPDINWEEARYNFFN